MNGFVNWIGAQADRRDPAEDAISVRQAVRLQPDKHFGEPFLGGVVGQTLTTHNFPARRPATGETELQGDALDRNPDLWLYRNRTVALLRRYMRFSLETGRLPSLVGREFFRAKVTSYTATTFEDRVIFVSDVEKSLNRLEYWDQQLIARIILQEHNHEQAAHILHCTRKTVQRRLPEVLDLLSEDFLRVGLLVGLPEKNKVSQ